MSIELLNIDCMEYMRQQPDKSFDLAIVDPPYGINAACGTNANMRIKIKNGQIKGGDWDQSAPNESYFFELFRVSKNQVIWGGNYFGLPPTKNFFIWDKGDSIYGRDFAECEMAWGSFDKCARIFKLNPNQNHRIHPTQKPVKLYEWILKRCSKPGQRILDTHLGSGSSAIAAHNFGVDFVGCELDKDYYEAAKKRFKQQTAQLTLF
jgi:site-specific DNA-methyltransferase (adenine-specific)